MHMFYKNIALVLFCSLLTFGSVLFAANNSMEFTICNPDPKSDHDEDKNKINCTKILAQAAKKACIKKQKEEAKLETTDVVESAEVVKASTETAKPVANSNYLDIDKADEVITPMFGRTLFNWIRSLML